MAQPARRLTPAHFVYHLNAFDQCPQKYFLKYVRRRKGRITGMTEMTRGRITHEVLAHAFKGFARKRAFPGCLRNDIEARIDEGSELDRGDRAREVNLILEWVDGAVESFDQRKSVHAVECQFSYYDPGTRTGLPFTMKAKVDLVVRAEDGEVEHIDWKTGKRRRIDEIQIFVTRIAVGRALAESRVRSTTVFLGIGEEDSRIVSKDDALRTLDRVRGIARGIETGHASGEWPPVQSALCPHCEYFQAGCSLYARTSTNPIKDDT